MNAVFHVAALNKDAASALARQLGLRRDWARTKLTDIRTMLTAYPADKLLDAARAMPDYFDDEDLTALTDADAEFATEVEAEAIEAVPVPATPQVAPAPAKAPDVTQVAALLAQLLATGKAGIDADEVREIVQPMIFHSGAVLLDAMDAKLKALPAREIVVKSERAEVRIEGIQHRAFESLLGLCAARQPDGHRLNVWLYGPPGTGKTTAARNVAKALGLDFQCNGALGTKYELTGFTDAGGTYRGTPFRQAWEHGGVYLFDEIDGSVPAAVVAFNAALANGVMAFPDGMIERHPDCVIVAAANTTGNGATADFTGRMKLDAATMDRFILLEWAIDEALEVALCPVPDWAQEVQAFRRKVAAKGVKVQVTPRATIYGATLLAQGIPKNTVRELVLRKGMSADQWAALA